MTSKSASARRTTIAVLFQSGKTMPEIAAMYGITRERVGQLLRKEGIPIKSGGRGLRELTKKLNAQIERDRDCLERYELFYSEYIAIPPADRRAFYNQRTRARARGIEWLFTLKSWRAWWQATGLWDQRGKGRHGYCMGRYGDVGPYAPENVYVCTNSQNLSDGCFFRAGRSGAQTSHAA